MTCLLWLRANVNARYSKSFASPSTCTHFYISMLEQWLRFIFFRSRFLFVSFCFVSLNITTLLTFPFVTFSSFAYFALIVLSYVQQSWFINRALFISHTIFDRYSVNIILIDFGGCGTTNFRNTFTDSGTCRMSCMSRKIICPKHTLKRTEKQKPKLNETKKNWTIEVERVFSRAGSQFIITVTFKQFYCCVCIA